MCPGRMCKHVFECCVQMCTYVSVSVYLCELEFVVYIYVTESGMCVCVVWVYVCTFMRVYLSICLCAYDMYLCGVCLYVCVRMIVCAHVSMCACGCSKLPGQLALRQI